MSASASLMSAGELPLDIPVDEALVSRFPIHRACRDGDVGALLSLSEQLSSLAALTAEDPYYGWTPLHWAAYFGQLECLVLLVQMGCEVNMETSHLNQTPTHAAATRGHPHCVLWLTQAGADVNRQDCLGDTPIHKAACAGSLECMQVLLVAGAKPHLKNSRGQTAADLAHHHGYLDCFIFISNANQHHVQLSGRFVSHVDNGNIPMCQERPGRKRLTSTEESGHQKKARRAETPGTLMQMNSDRDEEVENMNLEDPHHLHSGEVHQQMSPPSRDDDQDVTPTSLDNHLEPLVQRRTSVADMCGSLHLDTSLGSSLSEHTAWWGLMEADCSDAQYYGHYHGFGDTAEDLGDIQPEQRHGRAVDCTLQLCNGS